MVKVTVRVLKIYTPNRHQAVFTFKNAGLFPLEFICRQYFFRQRCLQHILYKHLIPNKLPDEFKFMISDQAARADITG